MGNSKSELRQRRRAEAFTLVELLVVISIIGLLAALTLGVTGLATHKMREKRMESELQKLVSDIMNYQSHRHQYPPDNPGRPSTNQLYYELTGTLFNNSVFSPIDGKNPLATTSIQAIFHTDGFANSSRDRKDPDLFRASIKPAQAKDIPNLTPPVAVLVAPLPAVNGNAFNPWNYVSTRPTNNPSSFDLWVDVKLGNHIYRISNWSDQPVLIQ